MNGTLRMTNATPFTTSGATGYVSVGSKELISNGLYPVFNSAALSLAIEDRSVVTDRPTA